MKRLLLLLLLFLIIQFRAGAKDFGVGITAGYVYSIHQMNYSPLCPCQTFNNKLFGGQNFGAVTEIPVFGESLLSIVLKIGLVNHYNIGLNNVIKSKYDTWSLNYLNTGIDFTLYQF